MMRTSVALIALVPLLGLAPGCSFIDPNKPAEVPQDPCVLEHGGISADGAVWYEVHGPAGQVPVDVDGNGIRGDFVTNFTGPAWSAESADCRSQDMFFGATKTNVYARYTPFLGRDAKPIPPASTLGYCTVNKDNTNEYVMFAAAGQQSAGLAACETLLPGAAEVSAEWHNCPGGERCPPPLRSGRYPAVVPPVNRRVARLGQLD